MILPKNAHYATFKNFRDLIMPIDKFSNFLFVADVPIFDNVIEDKRLNILSPVKFIFPKDDNGKSVNLIPFDKWVLNVLLSAQHAGNEYISYFKLYQLLGGKGKSINRADSLKIAIDNALWKLRCTDVTIDLSDIAYAKKKYSQKLNLQFNSKDKDRTKIIWRGVLLPHEVITASVNGKIAEGVIHFLGNSIIFDVADFKDQITRADIALLSDVPIRATQNTISLAGYLLERTLKIKGSNDENKKHVTRLNHSISLQTVFNECGIPSETKKQRWDAKQNVKKILDFFKEQGFIDNYNFSQNPDGSFSIEIFFQNKNFCCTTKFFIFSLIQLFFLPEFFLKAQMLTYRIK